jgi:hypothetical protein
LNRGKMIMIVRELRFVGTCKNNRKIIVLILYLCLVVILVSCNGIGTGQILPTNQQIRLKEKQVSPTVTEPLNSYQTRQRDDMRMIFIPQNDF